ncbi:MAG: tRNA (adenosine(37)-N6)-dimethylallyltransferase MiaA [Patescibacteria group bacterium]|nr:tRNA (adenosine(37)-N6)-dimethylallyltransferase MiaA [Patescibacteria group bacterium]
MKNRNHKTVVICGPTATGKTSLGMRLCNSPACGFDGEIISVDSRQVYKGMEIGTGKKIVSDRYNVTKEDGYWDVEDKRSGEVIRIHLYNFIRPSEKINAVQFAHVAASRMERVWARGKVPFLVGGAGLYLEILLGKVEVAKVPPNPELREELESLSNEELYEILKEVDPTRAKTIDKNSPHRLMRAIEIAEEGGQEGAGAVELLPEDTEVLWIGLNAPRDFLYEKIDKRVDRMIEQGLLEEVQDLVQTYGWDCPAADSIGYKEFKAYFEGEADLEDRVQRVKFNTHAYARRQLTWFRRNRKITWFDITKEGFEQRAERMVKSYLEESIR